MAKAKLPRLVVAGLSGDSGKTLVTLGLIRGLAARGRVVAPFKKGPDFIDAAWLGVAAGLPGRNLDTFLMSQDVILSSLAGSREYADMAVVEGNRGLFDGMDESGTHSTAQLAKLTDSPVVLVVDVSKTTTTIAALVLGCEAMDRDLNLAGIILNRVGTARQERVIRRAISAHTSLPVLGAIPRAKTEHLPSRHLGLVTSSEHEAVSKALEGVTRLLSDTMDWVELEKIADSAGQLQAREQVISHKPQSTKICVLRDEAFSFYYPENLEALEREGAGLVFSSPLHDEEPPEADAVYAGGGFPEVHGAALSSNVHYRKVLARRISEGIPVWAECGGLMYLSNSLRDGKHLFPMVGALPMDVEHTNRPQGHGYAEVEVDGLNPFMERGIHLRGHEFHYSRLTDDAQKLTTVFEMKRGIGLGGGRDGVKKHNVLASYLHVHALGEPGWAPSMVKAAIQGVA